MHVSTRARIDMVIPTLTIGPYCKVGKMSNFG
jgi:hypothetical protein